MLRKTFFVKPRLQFKVLILTLLLTVISSGVVYLTLSHAIFNSEYLLELSRFEIETFEKSFRFSFIWIVFILMLAFGLESIFWFHRLVGPIFVVERIIKAFASGDLTQDIRLRKSDELKDLINEILALRDSLKSNVLSDREICADADRRLKQLITLADQGASPEELKKEIQSIQKKIASITSQYKI